MAHKIAVFAGDGIGPEVIGEALETLTLVEKRFGLSLACEQALAGGCSIDAHGVALTDSALRVATESDAVLLGAVGGPKWDDRSLRSGPSRPSWGCAKSLACTPIYDRSRSIGIWSTLQLSSQRCWTG